MFKQFASVMALSAVLAATPALADGDNTGPDTTAITVTGANPAKCNLTASTNSIALPSNRLSNNDGFATTDVGTLVSTGLNALGISAWCTGASNTVSLSRTSLVRAGTNGTKTTEGFNQSLIYDLTMSIAGVGAAPSGGNGNNGNGGGNGNGNQGCGNGNGGPSNPSACSGSLSTVGGVATSAAGRFGPTGAGNGVTFANTGTSASSSVGTGTGARTTFTADAARLAAGAYTGFVTVTLTPGV